MALIGLGLQLSSLDVVVSLDGGKEQVALVGQLWVSARGAPASPSLPSGWQHSSQVTPSSHPHPSASHPPRPILHTFTLQKTGGMTTVCQGHVRGLNPKILVQKMGIPALDLGLRSRKVWRAKGPATVHPPRLTLLLDAMLISEGLDLGLGGSLHC